MANYRRRRWRETMTVEVDLNGLLAAAVGAGGLAAEELAGLEPELARVRDQLAARRAAGTLAFAELPHRLDDARHVLDVAAGVGADVDTLVVLGIGGSALGARALVSALGEGPGRRRVMVADSIDPDAFGTLLERLDVKRTLFNVISKSGETAETMAQFLLVRDRLLHELGAVDYKHHLVVTTGAEKGVLRQIVNDEGFRDLVVPDGVGGRFSVLTPVGLFPAAVAGIDVEELLAGAAYVDERARAAAPLADPALALAGALFLLITRHAKPILVFMAYCERLASSADWFCQLWAESLGKAEDLTGRTVEWGQTPVRALGAADQHSQLQLYVEGPRDKVVLFARVEDHGVTVDLPTTYQDLEGVGYLGGHSLGELFNVEQRATELALAKRGRPSATLVLPAVNAFTLGQLLYLLETATVAVGALAGIDPFGQPGVEEGKRLAYGLMGRPGFEANRAEVEAWLARVRLVTRRAADAGGVAVEADAAGARPAGAAGAPPGTSVEVRELFAETPARRKFLRSAPTEVGHVVDVLTRLAVASPAVGFRLEHDRREVLAFPPVAEARQRLVQVLGRARAAGLVPVEAAAGGYTLAGFLAPPRETLATARLVWTYVAVGGAGSGRWVRDRLLLRAVLDGYASLVMRGRHPIAVLFLRIPPGEVDVNVHPAKLEVRFRSPAAVHQLLVPVLRARLAAALAPPGAAPAACAREVAPAYGDPRAASAAAAQAPLWTPAPRGFASLRFIGQIFDGYLLCQGEGRVVLIDQD